MLQEAFNMSKYRVVASDLDGTLLNNLSKVSHENLKAIQTLHELGVYFVPSTGRTFSEIPTPIKNNDTIRYYIHSNGAVVFDKLEGKRISNCISNKTGREILDLIGKFEAEINIRHNGQLIVDAVMRDKEYYDYHNVIEAHIDCINNYSTRVDSFVDYVHSADDIEVFTAFFHNHSDKMYCKKRLAEIPELRVVEASEYNIEIFNVHAGKGNALYALADMLNVARSETISIGDSDNDSTITQAAGLGLAVSNACASLKAAADQIICSNEEHAVSYVLSHYFSDAARPLTTFE